MTAKELVEKLNKFNPDGNMEVVNHFECGEPYGIDDISDERVWEIVRAANLEDMVRQMPDGLDTMLTEHGENLSGGQRQRISIARAFARNPEVLILDEATSSIDTKTELLVQEGIEALLKGRTSFVIAHRLSTIVDSDVILVVKDDLTLVLPIIFMIAAIFPVEISIFSVL